MHHCEYRTLWYFSEPSKNHGQRERPSSDCFSLFFHHHCQYVRRQQTIICLISTFSEAMMGNFPERYVSSSVDRIELSALMKINLMNCTAFVDAWKWRLAVASMFQFKNVILKYFNRCTIPYLKLVIVQK